MQAITENAIAFFVEKVSDIGYRVQSSSDPEDHLAFAAELGRLGDSFPISTALDPDHCDLGPSNFAWTEIRTRQGRPVASVAHRLVVGDALDLIRTGRLWGDRRPAAIPSRRFVYPAEAPRVVGRAIYGGGLYIHPAFRGLGLAFPLSQIGMATANVAFAPDWHFCLQFSNTWSLAVEVFRYETAHLIMEAAARPGLPPRDMWICLRPGDRPFQVGHRHKAMGAGARRIEQG